MCAYTSDTLLPAALERTIVETIVQPTIRGLRRDGIPYRGFLYFGLMLTAQGPKVLEFNCRLGDAEGQAIGARLGFDLAEALADVARGTIDPAQVEWMAGASGCAVMEERAQ